MKRIPIVIGLLLMLAALCAGTVGGKLPRWCGDIADALERGVLSAVSSSQVRFPLSGDLGFADGIRGLSKDHDDDTFRVYNVHPQCGDTATMVDRAYQDGVLVPMQIVLGAVGVILILIGAMGRGGSLRPSLVPTG